MVGYAESSRVVGNLFTDVFFLLTSSDIFYENTQAMMLHCEIKSQFWSM